MTDPIHEIVDLTRQLVKFKSTSDDHEQLNRCADFIQSFLKSNDILCSRTEFEKVPCILAGPGRKNFPVLLMSHIDVVDGPMTLFEPRVENNRLYGRGSVDDKYAAALSLVLLKNRLKALESRGGSQKDLNFAILVTGDEEVGGSRGALRSLGRITPQFTIALDGGSPDEIITREKGILRLKLESRGKSCHASRPWLGENAIDMLIRDYIRIMRFFDEQTQDARGHWHITINPSIINGGKVINQVPDYCEMQFDIRYTQKDDVETLVETVQGFIRGQLLVESREPVFTSAQTPYLEKLLALNPSIRTGSAHGASDARHLMIYGLDGVVWGAQGNLSHHSEDEHVEIDSIRIIYERLDRFLNAIPF